VLNSRKSDEWGQAVPRTEDPRLLTGRGRYPEDFVLPRLAHAYVLRSPYAHAHIRSVDIRAAQQTPGVLAVLTGEDWAAEQFGAPRPNQDRSIPHPNERCRLIPLRNTPVRSESRICRSTATVCCNSNGSASATQLAPAVNVAAKSSSS